LLGQLLRDSLVKYRLELVEAGNQLSITLANSEDRSTKTHNVADLLEPGAADAKAVGALIERFVSPASWQAAGGNGTIDVEGRKLRVHQTKAVHHEIVVFCERLRLARGLRQRTRYPSSRLSVESPYHEIKAKLSRSTTFTFLPWSRLADVIRHWELQSGVTILVDWNRLADVDLSPSTPIACSAVDRAWDEVLQEVLEPIDLAWWAVDGETIQITTQGALAAIERTEFYEVPNAIRERFGSSEALVVSLRKGAQEQVAVQVAAADQLRLQFDAPRGRLLARGNSELHRYLNGELYSESAE
jgi:hypothetical protein